MPRAKTSTDECMPPTGPSCRAGKPRLILKARIIAGTPGRTGVSAARKPRSAQGHAPRYRRRPVSVAQGTQDFDCSGRPLGNETKPQEKACRFSRKRPKTDRALPGGNIVAQKDGLARSQSGARTNVPPYRLPRLTISVAAFSGSPSSRTSTGGQDHRPQCPENSIR